MLNKTSANCLNQSLSNNPACCNKLFNAPSTCWKFASRRAFLAIRTISYPLEMLSTSEFIPALSNLFERFLLTAFPTDLPAVIPNRVHSKLLGLTSNTINGWA